MNSSLKTFLFVIILHWSQLLVAQNGFQFDKNKTSISVSFQLINNLILLPVEVNGVELNFLIDTGVEDSVLFNLEASNEVQFDNVEQIKIQGFGSNEAFFAYRSNHNRVSIKSMQDLDHTFYLILNQNINISNQIGTPVNGILGYHFFKNHYIAIDYQTQKLQFIKHSIRYQKKIKKQYQAIPLEIYKGKPYISASIQTAINSNLVDLKFLIDNGNSDAIWFLKDSNPNIIIPEKQFNDFLGKGFGGDIFGKRARIENFKLASFEFKKPLVSFPDANTSVQFDSVINRNGSIGSEILRRFHVVFDYHNKLLYLKKNKQFSEAFNFNMSGIEIEHQGLQWVSNSYRELTLGNNNYFTANGDRVFENLKYKVELKPIYVISNVREDSPAAMAGLQKDDVIIKIDRKNSYSYKLQDINDLLKSQEGKTISFEVERKGRIIKVEIILKNRI